MTSVVINTYVQDTTETLTGTDDLLVTCAGSLVETEGQTGIESTGNGEAITVDGLVYSGSGALGVGLPVLITGNSTTLTVNGQLEGRGGVFVSDATRVSINVGSVGSIEAVSGVPAVELDGNDQGPAASSDNVNNHGDISAGFGSGAEAVSFAFGGGDLLLNSGTISGSFALSYYDNVATETIQNSGAIDAGSGSAIRTSASSAGVDVFNSGLIAGGSAGAIGSRSSLLHFDDDAGTTSTIDNEGAIAGSGFVIQSESDLLDITNSGSIHGGLYSKAGVVVDNSGSWIDGTGSGDVAFSLLGSGDIITNAQAGIITGALSIRGSGDTIDNAGKIDGAVTLLAGGDVFTNAGNIDGAVTFTGSGAANTLTNSGVITGAVTLAGATSTLSNHSQIYGDVKLASSDTLTNTGTIHGDVTLGATDTVDDSRGKVTGSIAAGNSDTFDYHGLFGEETIDNFTAGSGSNHDTIQFAANDFGSFSAVRGAMSQVGPDTLIRLDASDSITLVGVAMSSLVAADFKFV
jgi:trimeric autotransporter adhesin